MAAAEFWKYFNEEISPKLGFRQNTFRKIFEYLDTLQRPVFILETGCVRNANTYKEEGQSTLLFDKYASSIPGSIVYSVDIDPKATTLCKSLVSPAVKVHTGDSIAFLREVANNPPLPFTTVDLLYLDSYDVDFENPHPSALHHIKELLAISSFISPETLVALDDSPSNAALLFNDPGSVTFLSKPIISGKGKYIAEYAQAVNARLYFFGYQCGWFGLGMRKPSYVKNTNLL
ncbi:MAG: hypothetical protein HQM08_10110 [Candidatus Riflebacteria bacterium]|nr:hypothetical protein [Candidatus Riflebacteria bacterium]